MSILEISRKVLPHILIVVAFILVSYIYFQPMLEGKTLQQSDVRNFKGMSKEIVDFREATGEEALWTNSMFGGMPAYLISVRYQHNIVRFVDKLLKFGKRPANQLFLYLICGYFAFLAFGMGKWESVIGAIAVAFTSYNLIILDAGHNSKAFAIAYMAPILGGIYYAYRKKMLLGVAVTALFLALQLKNNHLQITYYTLLTVIIYGIAELIISYQKKKLPHFFKVSALLLVAAILALSTNFSRIWTTYEYGKYSIRGESELTHDQENKTSGLDKDYATDWSYGIAETFTMLIPNFHGGSSHGELSTNSETYEYLRKVQGPQNARRFVKQMPIYWGSQPFTSGPVYLGAVIMFLFVFSLFVVKGPVKWWLVAATILSVLLSWGDNFNVLTEFFLEHVPGYNKFRTVSMTLVIAQITVPILALMGLKKIFDKSLSKENLLKYLKYALYITGGFSLIFVLAPGMFFNFSAPSDQNYIAQGAQDFIDALRADRKALLRQDALRSLIFIALAAGALYFFIIKKLKREYLLVALGLFILVDLWGVDKRYLNSDDFVSKREAKEPFRMTQADKAILQDKDPNYRVFNLTISPFQDASTSYFHKSIGGYHGAKMKRYQELIEYHISKNNMDVLNMLNTKYLIVPGNNRQPVPQRNAEALGNAWFVNKLRVVDNADQEIEALNSFDPKNEAIVDDRFKELFSDTSYANEASARILLTDYAPNHLVYQAKTNNKQLAVFSEIYYSKGWKAFIDGEEKPHFRVNYVLRAMEIPAGEHTIAFKFEPQSYYLGNKISMASSILLLLMVILVFGKEIYTNFFTGKQGETEEIT